MHSFIKEGVPVQLQVVLVDHLRFLILPHQIFLIRQHLICLYSSGEEVSFFSGSTSRTDLSVYDWIENVETCLRGRCITNREKALFLYDHLEGEAKAKIRFRFLIDRENPEVILQILKELYGSSSSFASLQKLFLIESKKMESP